MSQTCPLAFVTKAALFIAIVLLAGCGGKSSEEQEPGPTLPAMRGTPPPVRRRSTPKPFLSPDTVEALTKLKTADDCIAALDHKDAFVRSEAADQLLRFTGPRVVQALKKALQDPSEEVRYTVARALLDFADPKAALALMKIAVMDPDQDVRLEVVGNLAFFEPMQDAIPVLEIALKDKVAEVRVEAVSVVAELFSKPAIPLLIEALKDPSEPVRNAAYEPLTFLTKQRLALSYEKWKQWWDANGATFELKDVWPEEANE